MWEAPSCTKRIMSHLSYCCDTLFKKLNLQFNWNKKEFYVITFFFCCFAVDRSTCIQYKLKICCEWLSLSLGSYGRNSWGAMHPMRDSQSRQAPTSLPCWRQPWPLLRSVQAQLMFWGFPGCLLQAPLAPVCCVCCAYHSALPHCRLPVEELRSVPSSCSGKAVSRQPEPSDKTHWWHKLCIWRTLAEKGGKLFKWAWPVKASLYKDYRAINFLTTVFSWWALRKRSYLNTEKREWFL